MRWSTLWDDQHRRWDDQHRQCDQHRRWDYHEIINTDNKMIDTHNNSNNKLLKHLNSRWSKLRGTTNKIVIRLIVQSVCVCCLGQTDHWGSKSEKKYQKICFCSKVWVLQQKRPWCLPNFWPVEHAADLDHWSEVSVPFVMAEECLFISPYNMQYSWLR